MTIIAGFGYGIFALMLTDSRLTGSARGTVLRRDVCQKIFPLGQAGLPAFCGGVQMARPLVKAMTERSAKEGPWWLLDPTECGHTLMPVYRKHADRSDEGRVSFVAQLINPTRRAFENEDLPRVDMVAFDLEPFAHEVVVQGVRVKGSGAVVTPAMERANLWIDVAAFAGSTPNFEIAVANKALLAHAIVEQMVQQQGEPSVGGLYQVGYVLPTHFGVLSYRRWLDIGENHGTYVELLIKDGQWWQEHPATGLSYRLLNPFAVPLEQEFDRDLLFDASAFALTSKGVMERPAVLHYAAILSVHGGAGGVWSFPDAKLYPVCPLGPPGTYRRLATPDEWERMTGERLPPASNVVRATAVTLAD